MMTPSKRTRTEDRARRLAEELLATVDALYRDAKEADEASFGMSAEANSRHRTLARLADAAASVQADLADVARS